MQSSATLELIIQRQLAENPHTRMKVFLDQFQNEELTSSHLKVLARLFLLAGEKQLFNDWLLEKLKINPLFPVPWGAWLEYFQQVPLSTATKKAFITGSEKQKAFLDLARSRLLDSFEPELQKSHFENQSLKKTPAQKTRIMSQEELPPVGSLEKPLLQSIAQNDRPLLSLFSNDEEELLKSWFENLQLSALQDESSILDVVYFFRFLEAPDKALAYLNLQKELTPRLQEIKAELLFEARHHLELLEFIDQVINTMESDAAIGFLYLRAQALFEIGMKSEAIELLESIVNFQPDYKLSQILLTEWKEQSP